METLFFKRPDFKTRLTYKTPPALGAFRIEHSGASSVHSTQSQRLFFFGFFLFLDARLRGDAGAVLRGQVRHLVGVRRAAAAGLRVVPDGGARHRHQLEQRRRHARPHLHPAGQLPGRCPISRNEFHESPRDSPASPKRP